MIVADTNLVSYLLIEGAHSETARAVYSRDSAWFAPPLWRSEFLNVLTRSVWAHVITERQAVQAWRWADDLLARSERTPEPIAVLSLAVGSGISAYDAQFVVLAQSLGVVLVTNDRKLTRRFPGLAVSIAEYAVGDGNAAR